MQRIIFIFFIFLVLIFSGCSREIPIVGVNYKLDHDANSRICIKNLHKDYIIPPQMISFSYNKDFIVAAQKPYLIFITRTNTYPESRKLFEKSNLQYYWIIDKEKKLEIGPLSKEAYVKKKDELLIPDNLIQYIIVKKKFLVFYWYDWIKAENSL